ncbi:tRNA dimethylallyltransferase [Sporobolomyces salmoneus]|uniref:tRNA dimethylallyltransferase n=1 Tax=Sporobolomyces salmoneus TaxID=183962 RepID=UPI003176DECA
MTTLSAAQSSPKRNLIAVIGTTGVGKSQLGVELVKSLSNRSTPPSTGEIINHDSMQCYKGLDVITNKATEEEMDGVPHHLMNHLKPGGEWRVTDFQRDALDKIDELESRQALPICVGGTSYYLQNLIFPNQLVSDLSEPQQPTPTPLPAPRTIDGISSFPAALREAIETLPDELRELFLVLPALPATSTPDEFPIPFPLDLLPPRLRSPDTLTPALYRLLQSVDPSSAERWHWRDVRKVRRALDIVWQGQRWQDVVNEQQKRTNEGPRFRSLIFWLYADNEKLHPRLDGRVDSMIERGLIKELDELWSIAQSSTSSGTIDYSKGIYQAIGYKEFEPYLSQLHRDPTRTFENDEELRRLFDQGVEQMKTATRQYAKRQVKWIKSKLLPAVHKLEESGAVTVVLLDATDLSQWQENVRTPAMDFLHAFLDHRPLPDPLTLSQAAALHLAPTRPEDAQAKSKRACETCTRDPLKPFTVEERQWSAHIKTKSHRIQAQRKSGSKGGRGRRKSESEERELS